MRSAANPDECTQGRLEQERGLPITPLCAPSESPARQQLHFSRAFLEPTLTACEAIMPSFVALARAGVRRTQRAWQATLDGSDSSAAAAGHDP